jgi:MFS family permease
LKQATQNSDLQKAKPSILRKTFLNLSLFQFISFMRRGVFYTFMINYLFSLMHTVTYTALLGTLTMVGSSIGQNFFWGRIADKYKLRAKLVVAGESIAAFAYLIVYLVHKSLVSSNTPFLAGLSLILGLSFLEFFWSMSDVGWAALLADVTTQRTRGGVVGTLNFIASLGRMVGILFSGILYDGGLGFSNGTIFYIVITMLCISATTMLLTSKSISKTTQKSESKLQEDYAKNVYGKPSKDIYKWFLASVAVVIIGATCVSQVFLLFLKLPAGLNCTDEQESLILTAWTIGGMLTSLSSGWLADRVGRIRVLLMGLTIACVTPVLYGSASNVALMAIVYGFNGVSFWTLQTVGFAFAGDIIPEHRRGRMFSLYNAVMALSWGPAGLLIGGPLADLQTKSLGLPAHTAYLNAFYVSAMLATIGTLLFATKVARTAAKNH